MHRWLFWSWALWMPWCSAAAEEAPASPVESIKVLREEGGRVDWSAKLNLLVYDRKGTDDLYDIYVMNPDGSNEHCLTCDGGGVLPQKNNGTASWHPSGELIIFQSEKEDHPGLSSQASPGFGTYNDLWVMTADGQRFYQLTDGPATEHHGVLHPHFSRDGKMVSWSEMYRKPNGLKPTEWAGSWRLKVADFSLGPEGPALTHIRAIQPGGAAIYENHGFSKDGRRILFSSNFEATRILEVSANATYDVDIASGDVRKLADERYNEHAQYSPNGEKIAWMTSAGNRNDGTDYWLMNSDGTDKVRLTQFNEGKTLMNRGRELVAADFAWSPDGSQIVAFVFKDLFKQEGMLVMIDLDPEIARSAAE